MLRILSRHISALGRDERASVFIYVAVAAMMLIAATGAAVDMTRAQILQAKLNSALDAAGLAAGATAALTPVPSTLTMSQWVTAQAQRYFNANFPSGYLGSGSVHVTATLSSDETTVNLAASTTQATTFMQAVGINNVNVAATSVITRATSGMELALVLDNTGSMASPVNSSDSSESKINALKSAINGTGGLLDSLYGTSTTIQNMWIGVVPFTNIINIGTSHSGWMDTTYDANLDFGPTVSSTCPAYTGTPSVSGVHASSPSRCSYTITATGAGRTSFGMTNWQGCVLARSESTPSVTSPTLTMDSSDDFPGSSSGTLFQAFYNATTNSSVASGGKCNTQNNSDHNPWTCNSTTGTGSSQSTTTIYAATSSSIGPNIECIQTPVLGMTATRSNISNEVASMTAGGSTFINMGFAWAYRMLSPNWQGQWGGEMNNTGNVNFPQLPLAYNTPLMYKVVILMTDGMNNAEGSSNYSGEAGNYAYQWQALPNDTQLDNKTKAICDAMKSHGIIIYTIGFGTTDDNDPSNPTSVDGPLLKYCATQAYAGDTSHYFLATTNSVLNNAFQSIGGQLSNLRVSQ